MIDASLEALAASVFAALYAERRSEGAGRLAIEAAETAVVIRRHLNTLTRPPDVHPVAPTKF